MTSIREMTIPVRSSYSLRTACASAAVSLRDELLPLLMFELEFVRRAREDSTSVRSSKDRRLAVIVQRKETISV